MDIAYFFAYLIYRILEIVTVINISEEKQKEETLSKMKRTFLLYWYDINI